MIDRKRKNITTFGSCTSVLIYTHKKLILHIALYFINLLISFRRYPSLKIKHYVTKGQRLIEVKISFLKIIKRSKINKNIYLKKIFFSH